MHDHDSFRGLRPSTMCSSGERGQLLSVETCVSALPIAPFESPVLRLTECAFEPAAVGVGVVAPFAPRPENLNVRLPLRALPGYPLEFTVLPDDDTLAMDPDSTWQP